MRGNLTQILQRHLWAGEAGRLIERHWGGWGVPGLSGLDGILSH
jgi:hypothetical protein